MECNRDEALRSKDLAEGRLAAQDYHGALKFLQKALQLFPGLENTSQIVAVIDVHIAAQVRINGTEMDWYGILQVDPGAEDMVIKKQYKKLALLLHPDKNKYAGAEAAFKFIGEALQVLSDKQQRMLYDSRRKPSGRASHNAQRNQSRQTTNQMYANRTVANRPVAPSNTFITVCPGCHTRYQYYRVYLNQNLVCHQCTFPFLAREYVPASNGTYNAFGWQHVGQAPPGFNPAAFQPFASAANFTSGMPYTNDTVHGRAQNFGVPGAVPTADFVNQMPTEAAHMRQAAEGQKRKRKDEKDSEKELRRIEREQQKKVKADQRAQEALEKKTAKERKQAEKESQKDKKRRSKRHESDSSESNDDDDEDEDDEDSDSAENLSDVEILNHVVDSDAAPRRSSRPRRNVTYRVDVSDDDEPTPANAEKNSTNDVKRPNSTQMKNSENVPRKTADMQDGDSAEKRRLADLVKSKIFDKLAKRAAADDSTKINNGRASTVEHSSQEGRSEVVDKSGEGEMKPKIVPPEQVMQGRAENEESDFAKEDMDAISDADIEVEDVVGEGEEEEVEKYTVPDPEFYDFDADRKNIKAGQVWACYDDVDGLPRFYLRVKEVRSLQPFRLKISWLELHNLSTDQQYLRKLGFLPTCGNNFKITTSQTLDSVDTLSHIVNWEKGPKGTVMIYPRKGDVWALYRNWKPGLRTKKKSMLQEYDMVEVLTDIDKEGGLIVAPLEKLPAHKTLFKRSQDCLDISMAELCRFSYQVPAYQLKDHEAGENEKGCWELDPASLPTTDMFSGSVESKS